MANSTHQLIEALAHQEGALAELLQLAEDEHHDILELDLAKLELKIEKKKEALARQQQSASLCQKLMAQLAKELEVAKPEPLSLLLPKVSAPQREELVRLQQRLLELGAQLKRTESANESLLKGALRTVNRTLEFFGRILSRSTTYGEAGRMVGGACTTRLLRREA